MPRANSKANQNILTTSNLPDFKNKKELKSFLDSLVAQKATLKNLNSHPDPLQVAREYKDHKYAVEIALICALFAYGNAALIVKNLRSLDFDLLDTSEENILSYFAGKKQKYRFQNSQDFAQIFISIKRLIKQKDLKKLILESAFCKQELFGQILPASVPCIWKIIRSIYELNPYKSPGYEFFFAHANNTCALKRYAMWLRWISRCDEIDLGLVEFPNSELLLPLDTHTHKMSMLLGLCTRKQANLRFALEATAALKELDSNDPLKYDFALYRISQQKSAE